MAPSAMTEAEGSRNLNRPKSKATNNVQFGKVNQVIDYDKHGRKISYEEAQLQEDNAKRRAAKQGSGRPYKTGFDAINFGGRVPQEPASASAVLARPSLGADGVRRNWAEDVSKS